ncbi:MAG: DNA cytosine methyltransferase [Rhodobacteraceae bacterium]|nr:DNA cytosine methyltransferase [Paracoccaceae bacterium]
MNGLVVHPSGNASGEADARLHGLSLCAGAGGIDLGLAIACPQYCTVCYVEREAYAAAILVARMEDKTLDCAPVWDDVTTFDGRPWRGAVDIVTGGYPCQPFSVAGKRQGADDPRHLWPHFARIIGECQPEWVFLENVANHINLGYREVRGELEELGYRITEGLFTAAEVGAPHKRQRLFVLAHAKRGGRGQSTGDPDPQGQSLCSPERQEGASGVGSGGEDVAAPLAVAAGVAPLAMADASSAGCQGSQQPGTCGGERHGAQAHGSTGEFRGAFPPGPGDYAGWLRCLANAQNLKPSVCRGADGLAYRVDRLRLCGNGVVPLVAAHAFRILSARFITGD